MDLGPFVFPATAVGAVVCVGFAWRAQRRWRLVQDLPTTKTTGVFIGLVEWKGNAEVQNPLTGYLAGLPCSVLPVDHRGALVAHRDRDLHDILTAIKRIQRENARQSLAHLWGLLRQRFSDACEIAGFYPGWYVRGSVRAWPADLTPLFGVYRRLAAQHRFWMNPYPQCEFDFPSQGRTRRAGKVRDWRRSRWLRHAMLVAGLISRLSRTRFRTRLR